MQMNEAGISETREERERRESHLVELVLLASEHTEDAFELDDLVEDWLHSGTDSLAGPFERPGPSRVNPIDAAPLPASHRPEAA